MKRRTLFIITTVMIITFTGCGTPKEVPALSESVEIETVMEDTTTEMEYNKDNKEDVTTVGEKTDNLQEDTIQESTNISENVEKSEEVEILEDDISPSEEQSVDPNDPDPSLSQEQLDYLDSIFSEDTGFDGEITFGTPTDGHSGVQYSDEVW